MRNILRYTWIFVATFSLAAAGSSVFAADDVAISNPQFEQWKEGVPAGWTVSVGAQNGKGKASVVQQLRPSGISLTGDAGTRVWNSVSQRVPVRGGEFYHVTFQARAHDIKREQNQYDNCYVGLMAKDAGDKRLAMDVRPVTEPQWSEYSVSYQAAPAAKSVEIIIFLSMTGALEVRNVSVKQLAPADSFDVLVEEIGRNYSFFEHKKVDWSRLTADYRQRAVDAQNSQDFAQVVAQMLGELKDVHVTVKTAEGRVIPTHKRNWSPNFNFRDVATQLQNPQQIGKMGFVGRGPGGVGYVAVGALAGDDATIQKFEQAVEKLLDAPGLIIDLRANQGGDERIAQRLVGRFTDQPVVYAKSKYRSLSENSGFSPAIDRILVPRGDKPYTKPIVCLLGPGCISSGEGMALMLKALPQVKTVGLSTAGASGNPVPLSLPNGVTISYSRWQSLTPAGELIEGRGVSPDIEIKQRGAGDPAFQAAVKLLGQSISESKPQ